jgi:hypothetical protein
MKTPEPIVFETYADAARHYALQIKALEATAAELLDVAIDAHEYLAEIGAEETPAGHLLLTKLEKLIKKYSHE